jgi:hypothetical protein
VRPDSGHDDARFAVDGGGALSVTETAIMYGKLNVLDRKIFDCVAQPVSGTSFDVSSWNAAAEFV